MTVVFQGRIWSSTRTAPLGPVKVTLAYVGWEPVASKFAPLTEKETLTGPSVVVEGGGLVGIEVGGTDVGTDGAVAVPAGDVLPTGCDAPSLSVLEVPLSATGSRTTSPVDVDGEEVVVRTVGAVVGVVDSIGSVDWGVTTAPDVSAAGGLVWEEPAVDTRPTTPAINSTAATTTASLRSRSVQATLSVLAVRKVPSGDACSVHCSPSQYRCCLGSRGSGNHPAGVDGRTAAIDCPGSGADPPLPLLGGSSGVLPGTGAASGLSVGGWSYDLKLLSQTSRVGLPSSDMKRNSWMPKGSGCHPLRSVVTALPFATRLLSAGHTVLRM